MSFPPRLNAVVVHRLLLSQPHTMNADYLLALDHLVDAKLAGVDVQEVYPSVHCLLETDTYFWYEFYSRFRDRCQQNIAPLIGLCLTFVSRGANFS